MSEEKRVPPQPAGNPDTNADMVGIVYILYLSSIILGLTAIVGVVMAYIYRKDSPEWMQSHFTYQIHTFWKGLLYSVIGALLTVVLIGFLILLAVLVWWIIRCVIGLKALSKKEAIENPTGWIL